MNARTKVLMFPLALLGLLGVLCLCRYQPVASTDRIFSPTLAEQKMRSQDQPANVEAISLTPLLPVESRPGAPAEIVKRAFGLYLPKYRGAMTALTPHPTGALKAQEEVSYRENRLIALSYPDEAEEYLSLLALDVTADHWDRLCGIDLLGELACLGRERSQRILAELAGGAEVGLSSAALRNLACSDPKGEYLDLYRSKCRALVRNAFDALSYFGDSSTLKDLEVILAKAQDPSSPEAAVRLAAKWTIQKIEILNSPECNQTLISLLDGSRNEKDWFIWALQVAKHRTMGGLTDALRRRLDRIERNLLDPSDHPDRIGSEIDSFTQGSSSGIGDRFFDDALIAYAEAGGKLNEPERLRLYKAGYACDPRQRLNELLLRSK